MNLLKQIVVNRLNSAFHNGRRWEKSVDRNADMSEISLQIVTQTGNSCVLRTKRLIEGRAYNLNPKSATFSRKTCILDGFKPKFPLFFVNFTRFLIGASKILTHPMILFDTASSKLAIQLFPTP